ncbi:MAG TPA: fused MFS/spermidine synthase [Acidimicrobiales bacterium]|nr:fused MFS/spermidine synthase [Acidimicrobiales bacterium]
MTRPLKAALFAVFTLTGFSALTLQVVWQRVISLHAGVDLFSITTVVSAFLAGLGLGSLVGGVLADRLGPRRSLLAFAASEAGVGLFAWASIWLFYDLYREVAPSLESTAAAFAFNFALLVVPTTLMGLSLPLLARGLVERVEDAGPLVGRLYAVNTLGAGVGAGISGWVVIGSLGFEGTVRLAGTLNLLAVLLLAGTRALRAAPAGAGGGPSPAGGPGRAAATSDGRIWPWYVVYGLTGAVALGLEVVFFRVVDAIMRGNAYTFGHLLMLYLLLFGAGAAIGARLVRRAAQPGRWFLALQFGVGVTALAGLLVFVEVPGRIGLGGPLERQFAIDGYDLGQYDLSSLQEVVRFTFIHLAGPLLVMGLPVLLMGASFPFVQALVAQRVDTLGRRTGVLLATNVAGNVAGTLVVGFLLIDRLGTSGALRLLAGLLLLPGLAFAATAAVRSQRVGLGTGAVALLGLLVAVFPSNVRLWAFFHSADMEEFALEEERACVNALKPLKGDEVLFVNGISQNGYPFDDFHVLIGLLPTLIHPSPDTTMAVGLGIGATPYGISRDPRVASLQVAELCGGELELQRLLAARGAAESERLLHDPRIRIRVADGRRALLTTDARFDVTTVDVVRPQTGYSGSLYSVEFYRLIASRLEDDGLFAQWAPTPRSLNSVTEVFPYVSRFTVSSYYGSQFVVASRRPIPFDRETVLDRLAGLPAGSFSAVQTQALADFVDGAEPEVIRDGGPPMPLDEQHLNRDLRPRDEFFLNNSPEVRVRPRPPSDATRPRSP